MRKHYNDKQKKMRNKQKNTKCLITLGYLALTLILPILLPNQARSETKETQLRTSESFPILLIMSGRRMKEMKEEMEKQKHEEESKEKTPSMQAESPADNLSKSQTGIILSFLLPTVVVIGLIALALTYFLKATPPPFWGFVFPRIYIVCVFSYLLWLSHLFLGMPVLFSLEAEFCGIITVGIGAILAMWFLKKILERKKLLKTGIYQVCPHCKELVVRLLLVCPNCNKEISPSEEE